MGASVIDLAQGVRYSLPDTAIFGRNADSTICLPDVRVSRRHAMIRKQDEGTWWLYDLGSYNGSYLNGRRITTTRPLTHGDTIQICDFQFTFELDEALLAAEDDAPVADGLRHETMIILVSDIKGFTRLSEIMPPEDIAQAIGTWYGACEQIIGGREGAIDKFIGDAVLAYWMDTSARARRLAYEAARELHKATAEIDEAMRSIFAAWQAKFACGVALHVGEVSFGSIGQGSLTMLGDAVNTAFRIQNLTRTLGRDILASEDFFAVPPGWPQGKKHVEALGWHELKGKTAQVHLYSLPPRLPQSYA